MKEEMYEKIEAYLGGNLTSEEQIQFELKMSEDPELAKEVKLSNQINHHLNTELWLDDAIEDNETKQDLENFIGSDEAIALRLKLAQVGENYQETTPSSKLKYIISGIAAVFILGLFVTQFWNQKVDTQLLYDTYYTEMDLPSLVKRGSRNERLDKGIIAFKTKNYQSAITHFEDYMKKTGGNDPLPYAFIGFSYLEMNEIDKALLNFDQLLNSNSIDSSKALWYKSLAYLKVGKVEESKKMLAKIISDSLNFNYQKAHEVLSDY